MGVWCIGTTNVPYRQSSGRYGFSNPEPLSFSYFSSWGGKSFLIKPDDIQNTQLVVSAGIYNRMFHLRPDPIPPKINISQTILFIWLVSPFLNDNLHRTNWCTVTELRKIFRKDLKMNCCMVTMPMNLATGIICICFYRMET